MSIKCIYEYKPRDGMRFYACSITNQTIPNRELSFSGFHSAGRSNNDVQEVIFTDCSIDHIPKGLTKCFPFMEDLTVSKSKIKKINKDDLAEYKNMKRIYFVKSQIEFLPGDLFKDFQNLEEVSFEGNKLKLIEPNILDGHNNLKFVNFSKSPNYTKIYSVYPEYNLSITLENVKDELYQVFNFYKDAVQNWNQNTRKDPEPKNDFSYSLKNHIKDDGFKDFTIRIGAREFHVHKFVLAARSPTLAEEFLKNPEVESLNLFEIPVDIFEMILNFMYNDEFPKTEELDALRLFSVAGRLRIEDLKDFAAINFFDKINRQNALEVLTLSNKYEHAGLKKKAYEKIQTEYPRIQFKDSWADNPDFVEKLIEKFEQKERAIKMIEDNFQNEIMDSD